MRRENIEPVDVYGVPTVNQSDIASANKNARCGSRKMKRNVRVHDLPAKAVRVMPLPRYVL
jgi:hypothetical protein